MPASCSNNQLPPPKLKKRPGLNLRTKLLLLVVGLVCVQVVVMMVLGCQAIQLSGKTAQHVSCKALETQAKAHLLKATVEKAAQTALEIEHASSKTKSLARTAGQYFSHPELYEPVGRSQGQCDLVRQPNGKHIECENERANVHVSRHVEVTPALRDHVMFSRVLDPLADAILADRKKISAVYFISKHEFLRYYPKIDFRLPPAIKLKALSSHNHKRPFATENPEFFWTSTYRDMAIGSKMVSAVAPMFTNEGEFLGIIGLDYLLSDIGSEIENLAIVEGSYSFLIDDEGKCIAMPDIGYEQILGRSRQPDEYGANLKKVDGQMGSVISAMRQGNQDLQIISIDGKDQFVAYAPVGDLGWSLATVVSTDSIYRDVASLEETLAKDISRFTFGQLIPIGMFVFVAFSLLASYLAHRFTSPLRQLTNAANAIAEGNLNAEIPAKGSGEVGVLAQTLAKMTTQMTGMIESLESTVSERTMKLRNTLEELENTSKQLKFQAHHDELTGLWNRRGFSQELERRMAEKDSLVGNSHLLILDLDKFKIVNDSCGHAEGDRLLCEVSETIQSCLRSTDAIARFGGDEFAVLVSGKNKEEACAVAERIRCEIQKYEFYSDHGIFKVGVSIGLVSIDDPNFDFDVIQQLADAACYAAKEAGKNRVHVAGANDQVEQRRGEMRWVQRLHEALENDRFVLFGQRIEPLSQCDHSGFVEVLLRLRDEKTGQLVPPNAFLPAAERFEMMGEIDLWVLNRLIQSLHRQGATNWEGRRFFVNLSGGSLGDPNFSDRLLKVVRESGVPKGTINFEVTETVVIRSMRVAQELIHQLKELGCEIALDDFGSGLSSLMYVKELTVDYLKIDGSFVRGVAEDEVDNVFVKSAIDIAHLSGIKTIAEYVESDEIKRIVTHLGADFAQGFGVHRPEPIFPNTFAADADGSYLSPVGSTAHN